MTVRRRGAAQLALAAVLGSYLSLTTARAQEAQRLDGIAAVVGASAPGASAITVLRSDVELRARMALLRESSLALALGVLPDALLHASLLELLGEALISLEANRLGFERPSAAAVARERSRLLGSGPLAGPMRELLTTLGVTERELGSAAERRAVVAAFMAANLEGTLDVSPAELERLFSSEPHPFPQQSYEQVKPAFAAWLAERRLQRAVQSWVESLRQRTPHRIVADYVGSASSPAR